MNDFIIYYGLTFIALIITLGAQIFVTSSYKKYSKLKNKKALTGAEAARDILDSNGLNNITVVRVDGTLTDHYDPSKKVVALSSSNYDTNSIAAISVAAHECGHALQDKDNYTFMRIRSSLVPITRFSSMAGYLAILIGCLAGLLDLIWIGIGLEMVILLFQIVTLPVEFNASRRALKEIDKYSLLTSEELSHGKTVLTAAALTYVASVASTLVQILRLILIYGRRRD